MRHPAFPKSVCGVVYEGGIADRAASSASPATARCCARPGRGAWAAARAVAARRWPATSRPSVGAATHYHADYVAPYWAPKLAKLQQIGAHIFYRWPGGLGPHGAPSTAVIAGSEYIPRQSADADRPCDAGRRPWSSPRRSDDRRAPMMSAAASTSPRAGRLTIPAADRQQRRHGQASSAGRRPTLRFGDRRDE